MEENRLIHHKLGFDGEEEYCITIGGLEGYESRELKDSLLSSSMLHEPLALTFRPDAVRDNVVYELKVMRKYTDKKKLILHGFIQLQLELYALGLENGKLLIYHYSDGSIEEIDVMRDDQIAMKILNLYVGMLKARASLVSELSKSLIH
ncbi:MAG: hypothetical protein QXF74_04610 [Nitrososphaerota archaeon]